MEVVGALTFELAVPFGIVLGTFRATERVGKVKGDVGGSSEVPLDRTSHQCAKLGPRRQRNNASGIYGGEQDER